QIVRVENFDGMEQAFRTARERNTEALLLLSSPIFGTKPATSAELPRGLGFPRSASFPEFPRPAAWLPTDLIRSTCFARPARLSARCWPAVLPASCRWSGPRESS